MYIYSFFIIFSNIHIGKTYSKFIPFTAPLCTVGHWARQLTLTEVKLITEHGHSNCG